MFDMDLIWLVPIAFVTFLFMDIDYFVFVSVGINLQNLPRFTASS